MFFSDALGVLVIAWILLRQLSVRPVRRVFSARLPVILGVIGLLDFFSYTGDHHVSGIDFAWVFGTLAVGAVLLGAVRAFTVRLWATDHWVLRQGTIATMVLWALSLGLHFYVDGGGGHAGASGAEQASLLLYLALTLGVQYYVISRRALPLWNQLGPDAGRGIQFNFGAGPGGRNAFFATFGGNSSGFGGAAPQQPSPYAGGDVIDAEVVEDDDEPPELPPAR
jgi:hypothetical protein